MQYEVVVSLKKEVLDTQGRAIRDNLQHHGFKGLSDVNVSKRFVLEFEDGLSDADKVASQIAQEVLANPVSETFEIRKI